MGVVRRLVVPIVVLFWMVASAQTPPDAVPFTPANFIDEEILARWQEAAVEPAPLSSDAEFIRRVSLDLTGRLPAPERVVAFLSDTSPGKRSALIDELLESPEFTDRWSKWLLDLMHVSHNIPRGFSGRDAFLVWLRDQVGARKPLDRMIHDLFTSTGNNHDAASGATNFFLVDPPSGPPQDTYDLIFARSAASFLGMGHYDCILCHSGRRHLDGISLWGQRAARTDAWQMAAFFSRFRAERSNLSGSYFDSSIISDASEGSYRLNTHDGNRPARAPVGQLSEVTPVYRNGEPAKTSNWRREFADQLIQDPMFALNFANRIWQEMMGRGLVEPVDGLDPDRLDPDHPPPEPWELQASHPALLKKLAERLAQDFDLRGFLRLLAESSTYQLASGYENEASQPQASDALFARYLARRLDAEQVHDAVTAATGVPAHYRLRITGGYGDTEQWAMRLPGSIHAEETDEVTLSFLQAFFPGDGNLLPRSSSSSVMQELHLMNSPFVTGRLKVDQSPALQRAAALDDDKAVDYLFLSFLSRYPAVGEQSAALEYLGKAHGRTARNAALEDLAWTCVNRPEFIINH